MRGRATLVLLLAWIGIPAPAAAQDGAGVERGGRIRVLAPAYSRRPPVGNLGPMDSTGLHLLRGGETLVIPWNAVAAVDVSTGRRSHWVRGAAIGGVSGLVLATAIWIADDNQDDPFADALDQIFYPAVAVTMGASGALVGGVIGAIARTEQWERVPASSIRWGVGPIAGGGVRLIFTLGL
jgi:hypothetical protein